VVLRMFMVVAFVPWLKLHLSVTAEQKKILDVVDSITCVLSLLLMYNNTRTNTGGDGYRLWSISSRVCSLPLLQQAARASLALQTKS
jgi:nicotinamide riboside transporter PnuC